MPDEDDDSHDEEADVSEAETDPDITIGELENPPKKKDCFSKLSSKSHHMIML